MSYVLPTCNDSNFTAVVISFSQQVYSVMEDAEPPTVEVCLILEGESERSIVVSVTTSDGSAIGKCHLILAVLMPLKFTVHVVQLFIKNME